MNESTQEKEKPVILDRKEDSKSKIELPEIKNKFKIQVAWLIGIIGIFLAIIGIILAYFYGQYTVYSKVDDLVMKAVETTDVIELIQSKIRPMMIFDDNGSYEFDMGALTYVKDVQVEKNKKNVIKKIIVELYEPRPAPLITCLDGTISYIITTRKGKKATWIYHLESKFHSNPRLDNTYFSLEILKGDPHSIQASDPNIKRENVFSGAIFARDSPDTSSFIQLVPHTEPKPGEAKKGALYFDKNSRRFKANIDGKWETIPIIDDFPK